MMEEPSSSTTSKPHPSNSDTGNSGFTLPKQLEDIKPAAEFPTLRHRWNTNEEIASILIAFDKHKEWMHLEMKVRPTSGSMLLYSRKKVRYRKDGYCWKKRKDGKNIREDHMKLKVQGLECIYGSYVHSDILPTFHRRCYWLLQNPDIVIVHYLNVPYPDNTKMKIPVISQAFEKKEWTKEELVDQLRPMFSTGRPGEESEQMIEESVEALVRHLIEYHENCDKSKTPKCDKSCGKVCGHSNNIYKLSPRGTLADIQVAARKVADDTATCGAKSPAQMSTVLAALKGPEKIQSTVPQGCTNSVGKDRDMDSKSESSVNNAASVGFTPVPYILSMGHLPTTSRYLVVGGQVNSMPSPITVSAGCHMQPISHLITQQLPGNHIENENLQSANHQQLHQQRQSLTISMTPSTSGVSGEVTQNNTNQQNLISNQFIDNRSDNSVVVPMQISGLDDNTCMLVRKDPNDLKSDAHQHLQTVIADDVPKVVLPHTDKLVPQLQSLTAEDVQKMLQSHASLGYKERTLGLEHCKEEPSNLDTENNCLTSSLGSADYSFDNLDLLDFPDVEKLVNDLSTSESRTFNTKEDMAGPIPLLNCANCLNNQRTLESRGGKVRDETAIPQISCHQVQQAESDGQVLCGPQGISTVCSRVQGGSDKNHTNVKLSLPLSSSSECLTLSTNGAVRTMASTGAVITDYCPEWSFTEGGGKMLITGSWLSATPNYTCVFDGKPVPTRLIQSGVLRCYIPAHATGCISLQVACDGTVISNSVPFEYKPKPAEEETHHATSWFEIDDSRLKLLLVDRLAELERRVNITSTYCEVHISPLRQIQKFLMSSDLEENLVWHVNKMIGEVWSDADSFPQAGPFCMTLLHLAAALGYSKLIQALIQWRSDNPCWVLEYEVDARCQDNSSCTPLMWACAKGHTQAAVALYHWNSEAISIQNREHLSPLTVARKRGHFRLLQSLEKLECIKAGNILYTENQGFVQLDALQSPTKSMGVPLQASTPLSKETPGDNPFKSPPPPNVTLQRGVNNLDISTCSSSSYTGTGPFLVRRQSDQTLNGSTARQKLSKRFSVDLCPGDGNHTDITDACDNRPIREANSEPQLSMAADHMTRRTNPMLSDPGRDLTSPDILMQAEVFEAAKLEVANMEAMPSAGTPQPNCSGLIHMDTDEVLSSVSGSPIIDVEKLSSEDDDSDDLIHRSSESTEDVKHQMVTLAKQIIAAMPDRIKSSPGHGDDIIQEFTHVRERSGSYSSIQSQPSPHASSYEEDSGISTPMGEGLNFDEYRYTDLGTPASSLSPDSTCLPSPYSPYSFTLDSPPPTTAEFTEYFNAPATFMEKDFSQLTLSDQEQRKLYEAAKVIQNAFRQYRDKQQLQQQQQQKEIEAAVLIQKYYRRYKQYAYYKKMTQAAVLIQSQFRSYYAQKRFKKSRDAAVVIQNQYRTYKEYERLKKGGNKSVIIQQRFRSHYQRKSSDGPVPDGHIVQLVPESGDSSQVDRSSTHSDSTQLAPDDESYHSESPKGEQDDQPTNHQKEVE